MTCSFCHKSQGEVRKIIAGNGGVAICNECVEVCTDILADGSGDRPSDQGEPVSESDLIRFRCPACGHHWKVARGLGL